jgi:hypothetical protein
VKMLRRVLFILLLASARLSAQNIVIEGVVTDWNYSPLVGVTVQISRDGRGSAGSWAYVGDTATDINGSYRFEISKGDPLVIYYSRSAYHASEVKRLSGARNAVIGVVLRSASEKLVQNEAREQLLTLEGMIAMSKVAPAEKAQKILGDVRARLSSLEVSADMAKQASEVWADLDSTPKPPGTGGGGDRDASPDAPAKTGYWEIDDSPPHPLL